MLQAYEHSNGSNNDRVHVISKGVAGRATKSHLAVDAHDKPITFLLLSIVTHDIKVGKELLDKTDLSATDILCTDKSYDFDSL